MAKVFRSLIRRTLFGKRGNLVSLDDPFMTLGRLLEGRTVQAIVDAGASDGRVSRRLMERFPGANVYAFEPNPAYEGALKAFAESDRRFKPQFCALAEAARVQRLHVTQSPGATSLYQPGSRLLDYDPGGAEIVRTIDIPTATLDGWAEEQGISRIDVIKLDIQGGELRALEGARRLLRESVLSIYTEVLFHPLYEGACLFGDLDRFLRDSGFVLYNFYGPKADSSGMLLWANAIYARGAEMRTRTTIG